MTRLPFVRLVFMFSFTDSTIIKSPLTGGHWHPGRGPHPRKLIIFLQPPMSHKVGSYDRYKWNYITPISRVFSPQSLIFIRPFIGVITNSTCNDRLGALAGHNYLDLGTSIHTWDDYASPRPGPRPPVFAVLVVRGLVLAINIPRFLGIGYLHRYLRIIYHSD